MTSDKNKTMGSSDSVESFLRIDTNLVKRCEKEMQLNKQRWKVISFQGNQVNDAMKKTKST